jgi:hypothetical protein
MLGRDFALLVPLSLTLAGCAVGQSETTRGDATGTESAPTDALTVIYELGVGDDDAASATHDAPASDAATGPTTTASDAGPEGGGEAGPIDAGCTPSCGACGASDGCGGTCMTGSCAAGEKCIAGACIAPTVSHAAPSGYAYSSGWARAFVVAAGVEAPATLFYTTDGKAPSSSSSHAANALEVTMSGGTFSWFSDDGVAEADQTLDVKVDASLQSYYGFIVEGVRFDGGNGPVIVTTKGATVTGTASWQGWVYSGCAVCGHQVVYGVDTTAEGCFYSGSPGVYPGQSGRDSFTVHAPSTAGTYHLTATYTLQYTCADAVGTAPLGSRPTAEVGWIIVK